MYDLRAYVLSGIDDGPLDADAARAMLRAAGRRRHPKQSPSRHIRARTSPTCASPGLRRCQELLESSEVGGIDVRTVAGAEVSLGWISFVRECLLR
jgi:tyrosine-protein phosphatase YwqE